MKLLRLDFRDIVFAGTMLDSNDDKGNNDDKTSDDAATGVKGEKSDDAKTFTQDEVGKLISDERKAERKRAKDEFDAEQTRLADEAETKRKQNEQKARGEFDAVEATLRSEIETLKADKKALEERANALTTAIDKVLESEWKAIPSDVIDAFKDAGGDEEDALKKLNFLPRAKALAEKLEGKKDTREGTRQNPNQRSDNGAVNLDDDKKAVAATGQYRM